MALLSRQKLISIPLWSNTTRIGRKIQPAIISSRERVPSRWTTITTPLKPFSTGPTCRAAEKPRPLPTSGFETIEADQLVEEESLPDYKADRFYPVKLGDVFQDRYQIITKLGFGSSSTSWLARDLEGHQYVALKVYVHTSLVHRELPVYHHIAHHMAESPHHGRGSIRSLLESFEVTGLHGKHIVLVFEPAQMSINDMRLAFQLEFDEGFAKAATVELLEALDFLHTHGEVVHTDVHPGNLLLGLRTEDNDLLRKLEEREFSLPVPRKPVSPTRTIYLSRLMRPEEGPMQLSDFGEARIGPGAHGGDIMPLEYRAPETLHYVGWSYPVDIWSVGLTAWDLLESKTLFTARDEDNDLYDAAHLAQLIAAMGPPPPEFLARNRERKADFWDDQGNWLGLAPIPHDRTFEALESKLDDKTCFLRFIRRTLTWIPEERPTARELLQDPWLTGEAT